MSLLQDNLPAVGVVLGALITYLISWFNGRKAEKRYVTRDAISTLDAALNAQAQEIAILQGQVKRCEEREGRSLGRLKTLEDEDFRKNNEIHRLQHEILDLRRELIGYGWKE